jgi:AbrB family looped-hinge helix DNA binding protein
MAIATVSTKGQLAIPVEVRRAAGLKAGDKVVVEYNEADGIVTVTKHPSLDDLAARFTAWVAPGTALLDSASDYYATHQDTAP